MKKQMGMSTVAAAVLAAGVAGGAMGALAVWQYQNLMHVRAELAESQAQIATANASANAARTQLIAIRKELDEHKLDFEQMRAERDSAKTLLEAERQHTERVRTELMAAREQLAASAQRARYAPPAAPQVVQPRNFRVVPSAAPQPMGAPSQVQPYGSGR